MTGGTVVRSVKGLNSDLVSTVEGACYVFFLKIGLGIGYRISFGVFID